MARFDVYALKDGGGLVVDCQADILQGLTTRFVVPFLLADDAPRPAARLNPVFNFNGQPFIFITQFAASIPVRELGANMGSLTVEKIAIMNALDMLLTGC